MKARESERELHKEKEGLINREIEIYEERIIQKESVRQTDIERDRHRDSHRDRHRGRHRDRHRHTHTHTHTHTQRQTLIN